MILVGLKGSEKGLVWQSIRSPVDRGNALVGQRIEILCLYDMKITLRAVRKLLVCTLYGVTGVGLRIPFMMCAVLMVFVILEHVMTVCCKLWNMINTVTCNVQS